MANAEKPKRIEHKRFDAPFETDIELVLHQPPFPLTEVDFLRLKQKPNPVLASLTGALLALSAKYGLPALISYMRKEPVIVSDALIGIGFLVAGLVTLAVSFLLNKPRKQVMQKIEHHFENNPGTFGYQRK
jgi:hypothetical protein